MAFSRRHWLPSRHFKTNSVHERSTKKGRTSQRHRSCLFEALETRALLSASSLSNIIAQPAVSGGYTAAQITSAYSASPSSGLKGNGTGQTIAIVDAYNDPNIQSDLATFDTKFGLAAANLTVVSQSGSTTKLPTSSSDWSLEISLDVEWAHAVAPGAKIVLVEANSSNLTDLLSAVQYASTKTGASVVSMSWGTDEFRGETSYDSYFTTPGVTFVASSGDSGTVSWPSVSPNVLAVGGTTLTASSSGAYSGETAWSDSGGGVSLYEALPSYQKMIGISASGRVTPDVSYDANPSTGFQVYDTEGESGWTVVGGTSAGAPQWAGIIAIANQQRAANGSATPALSQANAMIYTISLTKASQDFHDVTSGRNSSGFSATTGYDAVTGLGSPIVSSLVGDLATQTATSGPTSTTKITIGNTGSSGGGGGFGGGGWGGGGGGWGGGGGGWGGGGGRGGWSSWGGAFAITAGLGQPTVSGVPSVTITDSAMLPDQSAAMVQAVAAPISTAATSDVAPAPTEARSVVTWERGFGENTPAALYSAGTDEATVVIFGTPAPDSQLQLGLPAMLAGQATGTVIAQSTSRESDDAAVMVDGQPQLAPEGTENGDSAATPSHSRMQQSPADSAATSAVELSGSTIAALVFAWQLRGDSATAEKERRRVSRIS